MKIAVISDIHSNLEALTAVLEDIKGNGISEIYCLGDLIGYGPNPIEVLEISKGFKLNLLGNHDGAIYNKANLDNFNWIAALAASWSRRQIKPGPDDEPDSSKSRNWKFLSELKPVSPVGRVLFAHGSCNGNIEYIFQAQDAIETFRYMASHGFSTCFVGHTHVPCVITEDGEYIIPGEGVPLPRIGEKRRLIINVGSVGQPRDKDWRASYVIVEKENINYRRVEYDLDTTIEKIYGIDELNNYLGDRLRKK